MSRLVSVSMCRELGHQILRHARDSPRRVPVAAHLAFVTCHPERAGHVVGEHRLVQLGKRDDGGVHRASLQAATLAVQDGLGLIADHHMRAETGIAGAGVEMVERGRDQPVDINLCNRAVPGGCARAGGCNLPFHERNHLHNRPMMRLPQISAYTPASATALNRYLKPSPADITRIKPSHPPPLSLGR